MRKKEGEKETDERRGRESEVWSCGIHKYFELYLNFERAS